MQAEAKRPVRFRVADGRGAYGFCGWKYFRFAGLFSFFAPGVCLGRKAFFWPPARNDRYGSLRWVKTGPKDNGLRAAGSDQKAETEDAKPESVKPEDTESEDTKPEGAEPARHQTGKAANDQSNKPAATSSATASFLRAATKARPKLYTRPGPRPVMTWPSFSTASPVTVAPIRVGSKPG